ncbi:translesion DNA synthesis-associated protein ImuA [Thalassolituus sp. LLYu03]|uniref:translesion DNA synthesis-associated protein ImuA n=1 Tax=Thalassolituus sp. LLYu03 TaxID=3421656 RepID=UPI003D2B6E22
MATTLHQVLNQGQVWPARAQQQALRPAPALSTGFESLNRELPASGWQAGQVCEIYAGAHSGQGELSLILPALASLSREPRWILWVGGPTLHNRRLLPQPAALLQAGIDIRRILLVHPRDEQQALWSLEEGLKSGHCSAVLGWPSTLNKPHIRRLQLAASQHNSYCWLWPQCPFDSTGSPAALRLGVERVNEQEVQVECYKRRGLWPGQPFRLALQAALQ